MVHCLLLGHLWEEMQVEQWVLLRKGADFEGLSRRFGISRRLVSLIRNRDVIGEEMVDRYLNGTLSDLFDGMLMKDMDRALDILKEKIEEDRKIRIIGDYDIDGVNATYILLEGLEGLGASVDSDIPDRMTDGYGLSMELIERARKAQIDTIITCDNGIAATEEIAYAKRLGMTVIVTDHHEIPYDEEHRDLLPPADAVIDPKRKDCPYPFKGLCGAAVAYKLVECLYDVMGQDIGDLDYLIENVAIATVGDVMDLDGENRIFVKEGLAMLHRTAQQGLKSLIECTGVPKERLNTYHIGFVIGPCLNASGRLDTAKRALELLRCKEKRQADVIAGDLKALNDSRKDLTAQAVLEAVELVEHTSVSTDRVLVLYLPQCHESLAGIVAGRIRERYHKPVFVITDAKEGAKGSGRSIEAYSMYEELHQCEDLLLRYGGHKMAAGLSLEKTQIEPLRRRLNAQCHLTEKEMAEKVVIDMELPFSSVTKEFVSELELLEPFGKGNSKPVFAVRNVEILSSRIVGKNQNVLKMRVKDETQTVLDAVYFGDAGEFQKALKQKVSITYYPDIHEYMGQEMLQIVVTHCQS